MAERNGATPAMTFWSHWVGPWPLRLNVTMVVLSSVIAPCLAVRLIRRVSPYPAFKENNELVGFTYTVHDLIYGVFLAFTIVVAPQRFGDTERMVLQEASWGTISLTGRRYDTIPELTEFIALLHTKRNA